jgi:hypothetical protein
MASSAYSDEHIENIGVEEVRWKDGNWEITLGFNQAWELPSSLSQGVRTKVVGSSGE